MSSGREALGELDGILADGRSAAPDEDGALRVAGRNNFQGRWQLKGLVQTLQGGQWADAELRGFFERPAVRDGHDAKFGVRHEVLRERPVSLLGYTSSRSTGTSSDMHGKERN